MNNIKLSVLLLLIFSSACRNNEESTCINFPVVSEPIQITSGEKEHFYASYYGINSFDKSEKFATVLETDFNGRIPEHTDTAVLALVNLETQVLKPIATTTSWNFQQGCMAHWLGTSPDSLIIYNDYRNNKFVSVILNVHSGKEIKIIPYPVSAVSPDGTKAISINFARLRITRPGYGYGGQGQPDFKDIQYPENDGLFLIDLISDKVKLLVSIAQIKDLVTEIPDTALAYFNHTLFSRDGSKIFWLSRAMPGWFTTSFTVNTDGSDLRPCFPEGWGGSHFDWLNGNELMVTARYEGKQYEHLLFTIGEKDYKRLGKGLLDFDGHGTFSPDGKWMVTNTYPSSKGISEQNIFLMDMKTEAVLPLGRFENPLAYKGDWRCDIHCRWSPSGSIIGFNSPHSGSRQAYIMRLED